MVVARSLSMAVASIWVPMAAWYTPTVLFCAANLIIATVFLASKRNNNNHDQMVHGEYSSSLNPISRVSSFINRARSTNSSSYTAITTAESEQSKQHISSSSSLPAPYTPKTTSLAKYSSLSRLAQSIFSPPLDVPETQPPSRKTPRTPSFERSKTIKFENAKSDIINPAESDTTDEDDDSPGQLVVVRPRPTSFHNRFKSFRLSSADIGATPITQSEAVVSDSDSDTDADPVHNYVMGRKSPEAKKIRKSLSEMRIESSDEGEVDVRRPETARERRNRHFDEEFDARADDFISRHRQQQNLQRVESLVRYNEMLNRGR